MESKLTAPTDIWDSLENPEATAKAVESAVNAIALEHFPTDADDMEDASAADTSVPLAEESAPAAATSVVTQSLMEQWTIINGTVDALNEITIILIRIFSIWKANGIG